MNQEDSFWWQAVRYGEHELAKLIPSQMLEERYTCNPYKYCYITNELNVHVYMYSLEFGACVYIHVPQPASVYTLSLSSPDLQV